MHIVQLLADGDGVLARLTETGTHKGEFFGVAPTGKQVRFTEIGILRVGDGKIIESRYDVDMARLMQVLGVGGKSKRPANRMGRASNKVMEGL